MAKGYMENIRDRIEAAEAGSVFVASDFADIAATATIRKSLFDLVKKGNLSRVIEGVYEKPEYSEFLKEYVATDPDKVAYALARNYHWTIAPSGNAALNMLGLSTQVPASWTYFSDGPYKTYRFGGNEINFRHRTNKEITGLSYITRLVIHALKCLGKDHITDDVVKRLSERLSENDKRVILEESTECTTWVRDTIRKVCVLGGTKQ